MSLNKKAAQVIQIVGGKTWSLSLVRMPSTKK